MRYHPCTPKRSTADAPRKEAKEGKGGVQRGVCIGLVRRVHLTTPTETGEGVEHARTHEAHKTEQRNLENRVVVDASPSRWPFEYGRLVKAGFVRHAVAPDFFSLCQCIGHGGGGASERRLIGTVQGTEGFIRVMRVGRFDSEKIALRPYTWR